MFPSNVTYLPHEVKKQYHVYGKDKGREIAGEGLALVTTEESISRCPVFNLKTVNLQTYRVATWCYDDPLSHVMKASFNIDGCLRSFAS